MCGLWVELGIRDGCTHVHARPLAVWERARAWEAVCGRESQGAMSGGILHMKLGLPIIIKSIYQGRV